MRISSRLPTDALESLVALQRELKRRLEEQAATPEEARRANTELREEQRAKNNYYPELEKQAAELLAAVRHDAGPGGQHRPLSHHKAADIAEHLGYSIRYVSRLPHETQSVTDQRNMVIYLTQSATGARDARSVLLQALAHRVLKHEAPGDYSEFLRQRVYANYLAGALLMPEASTTDFLQQAKRSKELAIEDLRDAFAVSYESAAHRFTNLATEHLGITCHFQKVHESGIIHKAYENDGVRFPTDHSGAIEGQTICRHWTSREVFDVEDKFRSFDQYTDTPAAPSGARRAPSRTPRRCIRSPSECPSSTPSGSAAAPPGSGPNPGARTTPPAAAFRPRSSPRCGTGTHGLRRGRTRICWRRCRRGVPRGGFGGGLQVPPVTELKQSRCYC